MHEWWKVNWLVCEQKLRVQVLDWVRGQDVRVTHPVPTKMSERRHVDWISFWRRLRVQLRLGFYRANMCHETKMSHHMCEQRELDWLCFRR